MCLNKLMLLSLSLSLSLCPIPDGVYSSYTYAGCHRDGQKRDIPSNFLEGTAENPMTPDVCFDHCNNYLFFGLQVYQYYK